MTITRDKVAHHIDAVVGVLRFLDGLVGPDGEAVLHEVETIAAMTAAAIRALGKMLDSAPVTLEIVDARIKALHEQLAAHDAAADASLASRFDGGVPGPA